MVEIREHRQPRDNANASHHEDEVDETEEEAIARLVREQQRRRERAAAKCEKTSASRVWKWRKRC